MRVRCSVRNQFFRCMRSGICLNFDQLDRFVFMRMLRTCRLMRVRRFQVWNCSRKPAMRDQKQCQQKKEMELAHRRAVSRSQANGQAAGTGF